MKKLLFAPVIFLSLKMYGQSALLNGYYVKSNTDTVKCKIYYKDWNHNPEVISVDDGSGKRDLGLADITAFGIPGTGEFEKKTVSVHTNPIDGFLPDKYSDQVIEATVFLKKLVNGPYSLYELNTKRLYFFIQEPGGEIQELVYRRKQTETQFVEDEQYKNLLILLINQKGLPGWAERKANDLSYESGRLTEMINLLNGTENNHSKKRSRKETVSLEVFGGGLLYLFPSQVQDVHGKMLYLKSAFSPSVGLTFTYLFPSRFNRLGVTFSLGYSSFKSISPKTDTASTFQSVNWNYHTKYHEEFLIRGSYLKPSIAAMYVLNPLAATKFYVKAGFVYNLPLKEARVMIDYSGTTTGLQNGNPVSFADNYTDSYIYLSSGWINLTGGAGVSIGRHRLEAEYALPTNLSNNLSRNATFSIGSFGLAYKFNVLK